MIYNNFTKDCYCFTYDVSSEIWTGCSTQLAHPISYIYLKNEFLKQRNILRPFDRTNHLAHPLKNYNSLILNHNF